MLDDGYQKLIEGSLLFRLLPGPQETLYLGKDHLLVVQRRLFVEQYKRFFLPEIQTMCFRKSVRWILLPVGLGFTGALLIGIAFALSGIARWSLILSGLLFFILLAASLFAGPSYALVISSAVQTVRVHIRCPAPKMRTLLQEVLPMIHREQENAGNANTVANP